MELSTLEIVLIVVSVTETAVSAYFWRKWKKKLANEREWGLAEDYNPGKVWR